MRMSIVMPSHNVGPHINLNILNASMMGSDDVEVIIRDNSGNAEKRAFLGTIHEKNCRLLCVDECTGAENSQRLLDEAKNEFVFYISDDDIVNRYAIPALVEEIGKIRGDASIIGTSGIFIIEDEANSRFARFDTFDKPRAFERMSAFLENYPSVFQFSPIRRSVLRDVWSFSSTLPLYLSYHDWLMNCMILTHGRMTYVDRYLYQYYNSNWATPEKCLAADTNYFRKAGIDTSAVRLQWLIAIFEGAQTFSTKYRHMILSPAERQELAAKWIRHWFPLFVHTSLMRVGEEARFDVEAMRIAEKWRTRNDFRLPEILDDITGYYALSSRDIAERYHQFWR